MKNKDKKESSSREKGKNKRSLCRRTKTNDANAADDKHFATATITAKAFTSKKDKE